MSWSRRANLRRRAAFVSPWSMQAVSDRGPQGRARERAGIVASSVTMAWYSQSSRKLLLAKRTQDWRADRTMCAAVRITWRMIGRMP